MVTLVTPRHVTSVPSRITRRTPCPKPIVDDAFEIADDVQTIIVGIWYADKQAVCGLSLTTYPAIARPFSAKLRRSFATVPEPPVRQYGGLKDQDRIFTNVYCRHDHGIRSAQVRSRTYM